MIASGFVGCANAWQAFFQFFSTTDYMNRTDFYPLEQGKDSGANGDSAVYYSAQAFGVCARPRAVF